MPRPTRVPELAKIVREQLNRWIAAYQTPQQVVQRSRIILLAANGDTDPSIADQLQMNRKSVALWRQRFIELAGLISELLTYPRKNQENPHT